MNKYAMLAVKRLIELTPKPLKSKLKQNTKLVEMYSQSLHRSGLFYGRPSKKKHLIMYRKYLARQKTMLKQTYPNRQFNSEFTALIFGYKNLPKTLRSLSKVMPLENVKVIDLPSRVNSKVRDIKLEVYNSLQAALENIPQSKPLLLLNSGDEVNVYVLAEMEKALLTNKVVYCDTDFKDADNKLVEPSFFPDWNPELQFSTGYVRTGVAIQSGVLATLKQSAKHYKISTIAQLVTYLWLTKEVSAIGHVAKTLVHEDLFTPLNVNRHLAAIAHTLRSLANADVTVSKQLNVNQVAWPTQSSPLVSLIIPTKNAWQLVKACIESILEKTEYHNYEIVLIDNGSDEQASLSYFQSLAEHPNIRVLKYPGPFNYSAINNFGVEHAKGSIIGLINNDIEVIEPQWLSYMVGHVIREEVGCVGAKLLFSDGRVQHAGVVLGYGGGAGHAHKYFPRFHSGYLQRLVATSNYSAVTAACLLVKREHFQAVGGLNEQHLAVAFNDVDFCLKVAELGVKNVYCAEAELYHHESVSRGSDLTPEKAARFAAELKYLQETWKGVIKRDPFYSENLTLKRENFAIKDFSEF